MDRARNALIEPLHDESNPLLERNTLVWGAFLIGVVLGFVIVHLVVAQPMFAQLQEVQRRTASLQGDLQLLVGVRDRAWEAGNLLSDLTSLDAQLVESRATLREMRRLRQDLLEESRQTSTAAAAVADVARLQAAVLEQQSMTGAAERAIEQFGRVQSRLAEQQAAVPPADELVGGFDRVRIALDDLLQLKQNLVDNSADVSTAKRAATELLALKDQLIEEGGNIEAARTQANRLLLLQDELVAHADEARNAFVGLDQLIELKEKLIDQTAQVADAVQNLEILSDFREELATQIRSLTGLREGLMEIVLMETTIGRAAKALEPLSRIANVRRLGEEELRAAARTILDNRAARVGSRVAAPRELPRTAENYTAVPSSDDWRSSDDLSDLGTTSLREPPAPKSLPRHAEELEELQLTE